MFANMFANGFSISVTIDITGLTPLIDRMVSNCLIQFLLYHYMP
ncbi:hypothetical protein CLOSBL3_11948 [Clostridiaceae bacterium BL-3]|nr:hypothetical protein CLOSBL3_11948 [Clostridiaceae bacterium BL-3]